MKKLLPYFCVAFCLILLLAASSSAQEERKIKLEEYQLMLAEWTAKEATAKEKIAIEESIIADLKKKYVLTEEEIAKVQQEIYEMLGAYEADVENYNKELGAVENQINALRSLTPELLYQRQNEIEALDERVNRLQQNPLANIPDYKNKVNGYDNSVAGLRARVPQPRVDTYQVQRGDHMWKIAGKPDIYNDPYKWPRIWSANCETVSDPNLIYPDQMLNIIRDLEKNQRIVVPGEDLSKIASYAENYGDPFQWTKIYEANKNQIEDPNTIYPEQILVIPGK